MIAGAGVWAAPGRVNLIGEHTDYNDGFVLPFAMPQVCRVQARLRRDEVVQVRSAQQPGDVVRVALEELRPGAVTGWAAYPLGVVWALREEGLEVSGADLALDSEVPLGAGLSSSAALECAVGLALVDLLEARVDRPTLAAVARKAENVFVGVPCGPMDQIASTQAKAGHALLVDCRTRQVEHLPFALAGSGLTLLVIDTRAPHRLVDGEYAARQAGCRRAASRLGVAALRDLDDLDAAVASLPPEEQPLVRHVVTENARVRQVAGILRSGADPRSLGPLLSASHESMRTDYRITVPEVDVAVNALLGAGAMGARMTGGGFGGCVVGLVRTQDAPRALRAVHDAFAANGFAEPAPIHAEPSAGARRLS